MPEQAETAETDVQNADEEEDTDEAQAASVQDAGAQAAPAQTAPAPADAPRAAPTQVAAQVAPAQVAQLRPTGASPLAAQVGALLQSERRKAGFTQSMLADRAGVDQAVVSRVESGKGNPTLGLVESLFEALGVSLEIGTQR